MTLKSPDRVLVPRAPALVAGFREIVWLSPEGEIEALSPPEARARLEGETAMVCHARAVARRLDIAGFAALDLLELFAFVRPAQFCVPTPRGLAAALGLAPPGTMAEACVALATAARALLQQLQARNRRPTSARSPRRLTVPAGPGARRCSPRCRRGSPGHCAAPPGCASGRASANGRSARRRRRPATRRSRPRRRERGWRRCSATAPNRGRSRPITPPRSPPPLRRASGPDTPQAVLAEAGTGVGKTLGYIAPASLWAEKNQGAVWISTFTRNLQSQIAGELDRLYPDPAQKRRRVVIRKGRENYLCLLNYEDAMRAATARGRAIGGAARADRALDRRHRRRATSSPAIFRAGSPS